MCKLWILVLSLFLCGCQSPTHNIVTFGIISDIHQDLQHDACGRLQCFLNEAEKRSPDFIIQLGDMSHGINTDTILNVWNSSPIDKYSVFGNHEMDKESKEEMLKKMNMPSNYYSFDYGEVRFIVLDPQYVEKDGKQLDYSRGNYGTAEDRRNFINDKQLLWLKNELNSTDKKIVIFSHQPFDEMSGGITNRDVVRDMVAEVNRPSKKVIAFFCGHNHIDAYNEIDSVGYFQVNSASYYWVNGDAKYSNGNMAEYRDALYGFVTIDLDKREIIVKGVESEFLPPTPTKEECNVEYEPTAIVKDRVVKF